jgi:hypothetical protein
MSVFSQLYVLVEKDMGRLVERSMGEETSRRTPCWRFTGIRLAV